MRYLGRGRYAHSMYCNYVISNGRKPCDCGLHKLSKKKLAEAFKRQAPPAK